MSNTIPLTDLQPGCTGAVCTLPEDGSTRRRLQDLGLIDGTQVTCLIRSPLGDPTAYRIRGAVIALRCEDAACIHVHKEELP